MANPCFVVSNECRVDSTSGLFYIDDYQTEYEFISFRGEQGTQHPNTLFEMDDVTFSLTLIDGNGISSSINIGAYGGGLEQPFHRMDGWMAQ